MPVEQSSLGMSLFELLDGSGGAGEERPYIRALVGIVDDESLEVTDAGLKLNGVFSRVIQLLLILVEAIEAVFKIDALSEEERALERELDLLGVLDPLACGSEVSRVPEEKEADPRREQDRAQRSQSDKADGFS
jgi:hypothetical protein